jgi:hypothetical protein
MTMTRLAGRGRVALAATATLAAMNLAAPPTTAAAGASATSATAASIDLAGGNASASLVCGNIADAVEYADSHGVTRQLNNCHPEAVGGDIELHDVQIFLKADDVHASEDNESLAALAVSGGAATAQATCTNSAVRAAKSARNRCWSRATGGRLELRDVTFVSHKGSKETRKAIRSLFMHGTDGRVGSKCGEQAPAGQDPRDDCTAQGVGGAIDLRSVDVTHADGTSSSNVRVFVRGGNASSSVYCFNWVKAGAAAHQGNVCSATSRGGKATLRRVTVHVWAD